jgi:hypothetical protein
VFILGFQACAFKLGCSSLCVQVGVLRWLRFVDSWFPSFDGVSLGGACPRVIISTPCISWIFWGYEPTLYSVVPGLLVAFVCGPVINFGSGLKK